jgi:cytochrome c biogenesis protein CcdA
VKKINSSIKLTTITIVFGLILAILGFICFFNLAIAAEDDCYHCGEISPDFLEELPTEFTLVKIIFLAAVDAVNPCTLAVLGLMLVAILTYNPTKKRNILLAGLAFVFSVFVMYLIYGLIIIESFQLLSALKTVQLWLYKILGIGAIVLGCFKLKDFFRAKTVCKVVPKVDRILSKITSPRGAFLVGAFVTVFLLPCTIGPYIICGGILCSLGILKALPWLLLYNLIFVLPMLAVVLIIYFGLRKVEDISSWQAKNIRFLDLIAGLVILVLGITMVLELV